MKVEEIKDTREDLNSSKDLVVLLDLQKKPQKVLGSYERHALTPSQRILEVLKVDREEYDAK